MQKHQICVLGSANSDLFLHVPHIPVPGQTIQVIKAQIKNGGKGANQAVASARLNAKTVFVGQVGKDSLKDNLQKQMKQAGVQLAWTQLHGVGTGQAIIYLDKSGQNSIAIIGGANMHYPTMQLTQLMKKSIQSSSFLLLQKQIPMEINVKAAEYANSKGVKVILDCGGRDDQIPQSLINNCTYVSPNQTQLQRLIKIQGEITKQSLKPLFDKYPKLNLLLKQGVRGCTLYSKEKQSLKKQSVKGWIPKAIAQIPVIDTVGAGDCFTAAFVVGLAHGKSQQKAIQFATISAFLCVTRQGAMPSMPRLVQVQQFIKKYL